MVKAQLCTERVWVLIFLIMHKKSLSLKFLKVYHPLFYTKVWDQTLSLLPNVQLLVSMKQRLKSSICMGCTIAIITLRTKYIKLMWAYCLLVFAKESKHNTNLLISISNSLQDFFRKDVEPLQIILPWAIITTWSAKASASSMSCEDIRSDVSGFLIASRWYQILRLDCGSCPVVGSSRIISWKNPHWETGRHHWIDWLIARLLPFVTSSLQALIWPIAKGHCRVY